MLYMYYTCDSNVSTMLDQLPLFIEQVRDSLADSLQHVATPLTKASEYTQCTLQRHDIVKIYMRVTVKQRSEFLASHLMSSRFNSHAEPIINYCIAGNIDGN